MLKKNNLLLIVIILQISFFAIWSFVENKKLFNPQSKEILVEVLPVDPRDFISGNYFILAYKFNDAWRFKKKYITYHLRKKKGQIIYATLEKKDKYYLPTHISYTKPQKIKINQAIIKGKIGSYGNLEFGIEKYFINENKEQPNARKDKIEVLLKIDNNFSPRIKELYINDQKFR